VEILVTILLLVASFYVEITRKVNITLPATIFLTGFVFRLVYMPFTLGYLVIFSVLSLFISIFAELLGWWTRGDTWIYIAASATINPYFIYGASTWVMYTAVVMFINGLLPTLYYFSKKKGAPGIHAHTAAYILLHYAII